MRYGLILLLFAMPCWSQTTTTGKAWTTGTCSPAVTGSKNTFTINCGIDKKQGQKMLGILNKILANQLDPDAVLTKLDEIKHDVEGIRQATSRRHLTDQQKLQLAQLLTPLAGHKVSVWCILGDTEGKDFALDFVWAFREARLVGVEGAGVGQAMYSQDPVGIQIAVSTDDVQANTIPPDVNAISQAIKTATGILPIGVNANDIPRGEVQLRIGKKN